MYPILKNEKEFSNMKRVFALVLAVLMVMSVVAIIALPHCRRRNEQ